MLDKQVKNDIISKHAINAQDTGSSLVQIGLLTERISQIAEHLKQFPKDKHSRYGLLKLVGHRRSLQRYLKRKDSEAFEKAVKIIKKTE